MTKKMRKGKTIKCCDISLGNGVSSTEQIYPSPGKLSAEAERQTIVAFHPVDPHAGANVGSEWERGT